MGWYDRNTDGRRVCGVLVLPRLLAYKKLHSLDSADDYRDMDPRMVALIDVEGTSFLMSDSHPSDALAVPSCIPVWVGSTIPSVLGLAGLINRIASGLERTGQARAAGVSVFLRAESDNRIRYGRHQSHPV